MKKEMYIVILEMWDELLFDLSGDEVDCYDEFDKGYSMASQKALEIVRSYFPELKYGE